MGIGKLRKINLCFRGCRVGEVWLGLQGSHCSAKLIDRARPPLPPLSPLPPRVGVGLGVGLGLGLGLGLGPSTTVRD